MVLLNRALPDFDCVTFDGVRETEIAIQHLVDQGHQRIAIIAGPRRSTTARERLSAYRKALQKNGMTYDGAIVTTTGYGTDDAHRATVDLMRLPQPPTAIFVTSALATLGVLSATQELGLLIPDDVALIGCNESLWAQFVTPPLTMIQTDPYAMGRTACRIAVPPPGRRSGRRSTPDQPLVDARSPRVFRAACRTPAALSGGRLGGLGIATASHA